MPYNSLSMKIEKEDFIERKIISFSTMNGKYNIIDNVFDCYTRKYNRSASKIVVTSIAITIN